jgi:hypothetical protein
MAAEPGVHALRVVGSAVSADVYATRYALPQLDSAPRAFDAATIEMRTHLHSLGIVGMRQTVAVFERVPGAPAWKETVRVDGSLWDRIGPKSLWRLLRGMSAAHNDTGELVVGLPANTLLVEVLDGDPEELHLALPRDHLGRTEVFSRRDLAELRTADVTNAALRNRALRIGLIVDDGDVLQ